MGKALIALILLTCISASSNEACEEDFSVQSDPSDTFQNYPILDLGNIPGQVNIMPYYREHYSSLITNKPEKVMKIIEFANASFERRNWSKEFLAERYVIAMKYLDRSLYAAPLLSELEIGKNSSLKINFGPFIGSIGVTWAKYKAGETSSEILTMEETHGWKLNRPLDSAGKGTIIEARTYAISKTAKVNPFGQLWADMNYIVHKTLKDYPELMDKEVVYTYGDNTSEKMYHKMGFRTASESEYRPVKKDGVTWRVLIATPKNFLRSYLKLIKENMYVRGLTGPYVVTAPTGQKFVVISEYEIGVRAGYATKFVLAEPSKIDLPQSNPSHYTFVDLDHPDYDYRKGYRGEPFDHQKVFPAGTSVDFSDYYGPEKIRVNVSGTHAAAVKAYPKYLSPEYLKQKNENY